MNKYGGTTTKVKELPVGTKFYVHNGAWRGEIVIVDGQKMLLVEGDSIENAKVIGEHSLNISIR